MTCGRITIRLVVALLVWGAEVPALLAAGVQHSSEEKIAIFVGPQTVDGFVDVDRGILDSIKDIKQEFEHFRQLIVVPTRTEATLVLEVTGRGLVGSSGAVG